MLFGVRRGFFARMMFVNYQESIQYLEKCALLGSKPGLSVVAELVTRLGNPQNELKVIHLAGTNGKGSVGSLLQHTLHKSGYRVGFFTSPFLFTRREMIQLSCKPISETDFAEILSVVAKQADGMEREGRPHPTEFEIMTAAAYLFFQRQGCDYVIAEAGMGGGKDATNVMKQSEVSVLTRIDYDHLQFLGTTLAEITREKCGIFREQCPVVVYPDQETETLSVIEMEAEKQEVPLILPLLGAVAIEKSDADGSTFSYGKLKNIKISLRGRHQVYNAVTALAVLQTLRQQGAEIPDESIYEGFAEAKWQGRFEVLSDLPVVILDGAHNLNGAKAFGEAVLTCYPEKRFVGVVGMLRDKDFKASISEFSKQCDKMIVTKVPSPRAASPEELLEACRELGIEALKVDNPEEAVKQAFATRTEEQGIFCVGSLYALPAFDKACRKVLRDFT